MTALAPAFPLASVPGRGVLLATVLGSGMGFLDMTVVNVALPHIGADLGASVAGLQWTLNAYTLTLAAFVLLGGALGDRYGRRRVFVLGVVWFTTASVLCGLAQSVVWLVGARTAQGIGAALLTPGSLALVQASFQPEDRGRAIGIWAGMSGVSSALGPFVGGWLIDTLSWRWIFFLNVPLAALVIYASARWVPESSDPAAAAHFDIAGALLGALGLAGITYALIGAPGATLPSWSTGAAGAVGIAALILFVLLERRRGPAAMVQPRLFSSGLFTTLNIYTVVVYAALSGVLFFLVVYLQNVVGFSAFLAGVASAPITLLLLAGSSRSGALAARIGPRPQLIVGPLIAAAGVLMMWRIGAGASFWGEVVPAATVFGAGLTLLVAPLTASVLAAVEDRFAGVASGVSNAAARAGGLLSVAALPLLVGLSGTGYEVPAELRAGYRGAMLWCAGLLVGGAVLAAVLVHPARGGPER